ncbi:molybdopterin oxidoreductase [Anopheles sinensis]|uniref:Molybdopterin oxidoreductase n=1 Tax=Anopheles sinensis TaxID=74873 RepID=A0A084VQR2_ANOSI|nr:molybdopterin oxidoreductase [Anopheles sinensis]
MVECSFFLRREADERAQQPARGERAEPLTSTFDMAAERSRSEVCRDRAKSAFHSHGPANEGPEKAAPHNDFGLAGGETKHGRNQSTASSCHTPRLTREKIGLIQ